MAKSKLTNIKLFEGLDESQLKKVENLGELRNYKVGKTVFTEGDPGTHVYCVMSGRAEIVLALGKTGEHAPVHVCIPGSTFGEFVLFNRETRSATVRAIKPLEILAIEADRLDGLFKEDPQIGYLVMKNVCLMLVGRVNKTTENLRSSLMW